MFDQLLHFAPCTLAAAPLEPTFWLPPRFSEEAALSDVPFLFITWVCIVSFVGIVILMGWFMWRYNRDRGVASDHTAMTHHTPLEVTWSAIPLVIVIVMFYIGFKNYMELANPPVDSYTIDVTASKWRWLFEYPNGLMTNELHVPAGEPIRMLMKSQDVIHSFYIPNFRVKQDVVPGRFSSLWFTAIYDPTREVEGPEGFPANEHWLFCAEYCGTGHSDMKETVYVHPDRATFEAWLEKASDLYGTGAPMHAIGDRLVRQFGCLSCHTLDGSPHTGPTFKETWRMVSTNQRRFEIGPPLDTADPDFVIEYIQDSIWSPMKHIVEGYPRSMPTFRNQLDQRDTRAIAAFLEWLADNEGSPWDEWREEQERREQEQSGD